VYDPFSGTGTTLVCAKQRDINAYGVEAHAFVHWVAETKLYWRFDLALLEKQLNLLIQQIRVYLRDNETNQIWQQAFPELVYKCYHPDDLKQLFHIREFIVNQIPSHALQNLLKLALTSTLRLSAAAGTGWPYISPRKNDGTAPPKHALKLFQQTLWQMFSDLETVAPNVSDSIIHNVLGDSREQQAIQDAQISLALTSPPYLNNYDYADRTRLETYFWGIASSWKDITKQFRDKLIVAATTQIVRNQHDIEKVVEQVIQQVSPQTYQTIQDAVLTLAQVRLTKGGKKSYDLMVALYFNDMFRVLQETYRVLDNNAYFCLVLGDSAPYGVHIPTEKLVGDIALGMGFKEYDYYPLRTRGGKWRDNPQRHSVPLKEGIVVLRK